MKSKYDQRGVSAQKEEIHAAIKNLDKGLYPNAFCKILPDVCSRDEDYVNIMHADTAGTKTSLAYAYWRETEDLSVWKGIAQDALVMNIDDLLCVGVTQDIIISSTIARNKHLVSGDVIKTIIEANNDFAEKMKEYGVTIHLSGGETADVGDIVRTIDVGITAFARIPKKDVININLKPGNVIVGLASFGQAIYENNYNYGTGSNGLTSARHDLFNKEVAHKYPESFDPNTSKEVIYTGNYFLTDTADGYKDTVGKMVLSPTRTYAPILREIIAQHKKKISGIIHCSGGGQTKVMHFAKNVQIIKDNLFETPSLFKLIQESSGVSSKEMFQVFNMGHRLEIYCDPLVAQSIIDISQSYQVDAKVIGKVFESDSKSLIIRHNHEEINY